MTHHAVAPAFIDHVWRPVAVAATALLVTAATGCGSSTPALATVPVSGMVKVDGSSLPEVRVSYLPIDGTPGRGGWTKTDGEGRYDMRTPWIRSGLTGMSVTWLEGLPPGRYRVVVSRRLHADGSPMRDDEAPLESPAVETIAAVYSDEIAGTLAADVPAAGGTFDWNVKSMPRPK
jgi:hypothetical protein